MDDLTYLYSGNRLRSVEDAVPPATYPSPEDFQNRASMTNEYLYDPNGNLLQDLNAGFTLAYNHLNKPVEIGETATGNTLKITYAADGTKLRQTTYQTGSAPQTLDYSTGYIYKGRVLLHLAHEEGRSLRLNASGNNGGGPSHGHVHTFRHEYNLRDHLGNLRVSFTDADQDGKPEITQEYHYEAYGLRLGGLTYMGGEEERYAYSGKERIGELGLGWTDFGARMYNPTIGRWNGVDALAEKYAGIGGYVYVAGNPVKLVDVDGREIVPADDLSAWLFNRIYNSAPSETKAKLDLLKASDVKYYIDCNAKLTGQTGSAEYDFGENRMNILVDHASPNKIASLGDELEGAFQFETGRVGFVLTTGGVIETLGYDMEDEAASKRASVEANTSVNKRESPEGESLLALPSTTQAFHKADTDPIMEGSTRNAMIENYFKTDESAARYLPRFDMRGRKMGVNLSGSANYSQEQLQSVVGKQFKRFIYRAKEGDKFVSKTEKSK